MPVEASFVMLFSGFFCFVLFWVSSLDLRKQYLRELNFKTGQASLFIDYYFIMDK